MRSQPPLPCSTITLLTFGLNTLKQGGQRTDRGPELPWTTVLGRMASGYMPMLAEGVSPLAVLIVLGVVMWPRLRRRSVRALATAKPAVETTS